MNKTVFGKEGHCLSFPPSADSDAEILILGSMPGEESLRQQQYYAFRHNAFWRIMGELFSFEPSLPYPERLAALRHNRVALWDVISSCSRTGSLDSAIREPRPNDIRNFLLTHQKIRLIVCNGGTAARCFRRFFPDLAPRMLPLVSTSPAAAGIPYDEKLSRWRSALTR